MRTPIETHAFVSVPTTKRTLEVFFFLFFFYREAERDSCVPVCWRCCEIKSSPPPGGKAKLSGVRGQRHWSGHTCVRTLFTTREAHVRPPTSVLPQYCTSAGGALHHDALGGSKAPYTAFSRNPYRQWKTRPTVYIFCHWIEPAFRYCFKCINGNACTVCAWPCP